MLHRAEVHGHVGAFAAVQQGVVAAVEAPAGLGNGAGLDQVELHPTTGHLRGDGVLQLGKVDQEVQREVPPWPKKSTAICTFCASFTRSEKRGLMQSSRAQPVSPNSGTSQ